MKIRHLITYLLLLVASGASGQLLYKVEGNGLTAPSYIFGTHHLAPLWVIDSVGAREAFDAARQVVGEIDMTQDQVTLAMAMQPHMMAPADSTLSKVISAADFAAASEAFRKWAPMPGMELKMLEPMKPMVVSTMVAVGITKQAMPEFDPAQQLDTWFQTAGKAAGKEITPLETADFQAGVLYGSTPIAWQAEELVEMLRDPDRAMSMATALTEAYLAQDLEKMRALSADEDNHPEFTAALLYRRNADWLTKLPAIMQRMPAFIAVGALHLAGDQGIIAGLREMGYTVTPVSK